MELICDYMKKVLSPDLDCINGTVWGWVNCQIPDRRAFWAVIQRGSRLYKAELPDSPDFLELGRRGSGWAALPRAAWAAIRDAGQLFIAV